MPAPSNPAEVYRELSVIIQENDSNNMAQLVSDFMSSEKYTSICEDLQVQRAAIFSTIPGHVDTREFSHYSYDKYCHGTSNVPYNYHAKFLTTLQNMVILVSLPTIGVDPEDTYNDFTKLIAQNRNSDNFEQVISDFTHTTQYINTCRDLERIQAVIYLTGPISGNSPEQLQYASKLYCYDNVDTWYDNKPQINSVQKIIGAIQETLKLG